MRNFVFMTFTKKTYPHKVIEKKIVSVCMNNIHCKNSKLYDQMSMSSYFINFMIDLMVYLEYKFDSSYSIKTKQEDESSIPSAAYNATFKSGRDQI